MQPKKIPVRRCSGCGEGKPKKELIRVVRTAEGEILIGKKAGRGAYICPNVQCLAKAKKAKRFERSFQCQIPGEIYQQLEKQLEEGIYAE